jgi:phage baseplate assembly protein gpV
MAMVRVHMQAGQALTDAQSMKLQTLMKAMQEMHHEGMMGEGMQHGEGMQRRQHQGMRSGG